MANSGRGGHPGGFGRGGGRGRGRGRGRRRRNEEEAKEWIPITKLGRLVKNGRIRSLEEVFLFSIPIKEAKIVENLLTGLQDEVLKIMPVQKQTTAGRRTRFKAFVIVGDKNGHVGLGVRSANDVAAAIRGAIVNSKLNIVPLRRGYWGAKIDAPHTVPCKVTGKCGGVRVRLVPAPRGTGIVAARVPKKLLQMAGLEDIFSSSSGRTSTFGNFAEAAFNAIKATYTYITPDLWKETRLQKHPFDTYSELLAKTKQQ